MEGLAEKATKQSGQKKGGRGWLAARSNIVKTAWDALSNEDRQRYQDIAAERTKGEIPPEMQRK